MKNFLSKLWKNWGGLYLGLAYHLVLTYISENVEGKWSQLALVAFFALAYVFAFALWGPVEKETQKHIRENLEVSKKKQQRKINFSQKEFVNYREMEDMNKQAAILENYINDIPLIIDPCRLCKKQQEASNDAFTEECFECCYFYGSKFEAKEVKE